MEKPLRYAYYSVPAGAVVQVFTGPAIIKSLDARWSVKFYDEVSSAAPVTDPFATGNVPSPGVKVENGLLIAGATQAFDGLVYYYLPEDYL